MANHHFDTFQMDTYRPSTIHRSLIYPPWVLELIVNSNGQTKRFATSSVCVILLLCRLLHNYSRENSCESRTKCAHFMCPEHRMCWLVNIRHFQIFILTEPFFYVWYFVNYAHTSDPMWMQEIQLFLIFECQPKTNVEIMKKMPTFQTT